MDLLRKYLLSSVTRAPDEGGAAATAAGTGADAGKGAATGADAGKGAGGAGDGSAAPPAAWYESKDFALEDDIKVFIAGKKTPDLKTGLKSWMEADRKARERNVIDKPDPKNLAGWQGWTDLGWVADPAKYEVKAPDEKAIKFPYNAEVMGTIKTTAHKHHVPLTAAQAIHDDLLQAYGKYQEAAEGRGASALKETQEALDKEWGIDKPRNIELAKRAANTFGVGIEDLGELEKVTGSPRLLKMFHAIGAKLGEANLIGDGARGGGPSPSSMAELRAELNRVQGDKEFMEAFRNPRHPQHNDRQAQHQAIINKIAALELKARRQPTAA